MWTKSSILVFLFFALSCTKEKDIPFLDSVKDTIHVTSYLDIAGTYEGRISNINFVSSNSYVILSSQIYSVEVVEINFDKVLIKNISNNVLSDAEAEMFRFNENGGYLRFLTHTMADSMSIDSVFNGNYNGIYYYSNDSLSYFFNYIVNKDTVHQLFSGKLN